MVSDNSDRWQTLAEKVYCLSISTSFMNIGSLFPEIWEFKGWQPHPFLQKLSKFGGPYLTHHWSDWPKILDLVLWVPKQHVYQVSLKSETVGFKFSVILSDLTQNDPHLLTILTALWWQTRITYLMIIKFLKAIYYVAHIAVHARLFIFGKNVALHSLFTTAANVDPSASPS